MTNAIDNSGLVNGLHLKGTPIAAFTPGVSYTYDGTDLVIRDGSTFPSGDGLLRAHVRVVDQFGGEIRDTITTTGVPGAKTISTAALNKAEAITVHVTVITNRGLAADGHAKLAPAGTVGYWDKNESGSIN